ncbi:salt stress-induced protein-like [Miscanthus floridulus]|uniref:salt stress-induced protein-like n=1 Tax=Miscanthus floridulus TaxID=154761 RepID=UPI003459474A
MRGASAPRLRSIILYHSGAVHSLSCEYTLAGDYGGPPPRVAGPWGLPDSYGSRGVRTQIDLRSGEHITAVEGTTGHFANVPGVVTTSLTFRTSAGRTYGPYGSVAAGSHYFSVPAADGACIVGFWGRSGWLVDAIGVYMKSSSSSSSSDTAAYKKYASRRQGRN